MMMNLYECSMEALKVYVIGMACLFLFAFVFIKLLGEEALRTFFITALAVWMTTFAVYAMYGDRS